MFLAPGTSLVEDNFPQMWWDVFRMIQVHYIIVNFISVITTSAPPQITRHEIQEVGDPCSIPPALMNYDTETVTSNDAS